MSGYLVFELGGRELAAPLMEVREVVRIDRLDPLPGLEPPVTGLMQLRGRPLPVCDLRRDRDDLGGPEVGDIVLLGMPDGSMLGVAVDRVVAVVDQDSLVADDGVGVPLGFPPYVVGVLHHADRPDDTVFLVEMARLVETSGLLAAHT